MLSSRRAILYHANSILRSNHNIYASRLSSISHKNQQGPKTPEELSRLYKTADGAEVDSNATTSSDIRSSGATNARKLGAEKDPYEEPQETADSVARTAKVAAAGAVETGLRLGKMAKQTVDGIWGAAEETAENVRDSVADDIDNGGRRRAHETSSDINDRFEDRRRARTSDIDDRIEEESSDKFVEELRRRANGYDLKDGR